MLLRYIRLIMKRERWNSMAWLFGFSTLVVAFAPLFANLFATPEELAAITATMNSPAMIALVGPVYGLSALTPEIAMAQTSLLLFVIAIAVMNI